jgi:hypothetical protein
VEVTKRRKQTIVEFLRRRDVHDGGEAVVGRLAAIDVVVGMDGVLRAELSAEHLDGAVGDHLVGVHVRLRARPGLEHDQREVVVELAGDDFVRRRDDQLGEVGFELTQLGVRLRRRPLQDPERAHDRPPHHEGGPADREVVQAALGLRAPVAVRLDHDRSQAVGLDACAHVGIFA